jgi:CheY-like chemotaxis protein
MTARVLVIDDAPANVKLLEARLSAEYFDVVTATSGAEGLAICDRAQCDIVLLDVMMPDMDGANQVVISSSSASESFSPGMSRVVTSSQTLVSRRR